MKAIGDALLIRVHDAAATVRLADRIVCDYAVRDRALGVRIGMHTGTAVRRGEDWFGSGVNLASRVSGLALSGEVLLTGQTRRAAGNRIAVRSRGRRAFKNVSFPIELFELVLSQPDLPALTVDPVCRMTIDPARASRDQNYRDAQYYFCPDRCAEAFAREPSRYTRRSASREHSRVSDDARERVVQRFNRAYAKGRRESDEFEQRLRRIYTARTRRDLKIAAADLPRRVRRLPLVVVCTGWLTGPIRRYSRRRQK